MRLNQTIYIRFIYKHIEFYETRPLRGFFIKKEEKKVRI